MRLGELRIVRGQGGDEDKAISAGGNGNNKNNSGRGWGQS